MSYKMIGIPGGMGSYTEIDLMKKIYNIHGATTDQNQIPINVLSIPHKIVDRTEFLLGRTKTNPGIAISEIVSTLISNGAEVIGIPCNTAHVASIFNLVKKNIPPHCKLINMIEEVGLYISRYHPGIKLVGVLSTTGTANSKVYPDMLGKFKIKVIQPSADIQKRLVHPAIYDRDYGIKSYANPIKEQARNNLVTAAGLLIQEGAQAIIMGCTEIPLAFTEEKIEGRLLIDTTYILASALVRDACNKNIIDITKSQRLAKANINDINSTCA